MDRKSNASSTSMIHTDAKMSNEKNIGDWFSWFWVNCFQRRNIGTGKSNLMVFAYFRWLLVIISIQLSANLYASATFNLYLDRREFQKLHGISSDIYYIQEGVVNEYALNFVVTVPPEVEDLHFSWQALTKKPIHYDMSYDYTDFFALSQPFSNISSIGRVPQSLETFRVTLPCSGRSNSEVAVTIRMNFQIKYPKPNTTSITIKRNKICLFKEMTSKSPVLPELPGLFPPSAVETNQITQQKPHHHNQTPTHISSNPMLNSTLLFQDPGPSLLLAGLLGGCAVTASVVFLTFFICLKRKLVTTSLTSSQNRSSPIYPCHEPNSSSNNSSPACLLRQSHMATTVSSGTGGLGTKTMSITDDNQMWKHFTKPEKVQAGTGTINSGSGSHNSYMTVASFWNDLFSSSTPHNCRMAKVSSNSIANSAHRGSDVSPYAYAHIVPTNQQQLAPPVPKSAGLPTPPTLIEWYSQSFCHNDSTTNSNISKGGSTHSNDVGVGHIYANNLYSFTPLKYNSPAKPLSASQIRVDTEDEEEEASRNERPENNSSTMRSGSESLIQIDGFQCRRNMAKESHIVERFL